MEMRMYLREWLGIDLTTLPAAAEAQDKPASAEFYAQFYQALASGRGKIDPQWLESKRELGEAIERFIIAPWQQQHKRSPRILALGAGKAPVERVWHQRGHAVTFHDCQEDSLAEVRRLHPQAEFLVGDISKLAPVGRYALVTMICVDYVLNRREFIAFLSRAVRWLEPGGQIVLFCASTLSFRQMAAEIIKRSLGRYRNGRRIFWGYWRTPGEFFATARQAGLRVARVYRAGGSGLREVAPLLRRLPPLRDNGLIMTLELNP